MFREVGVVREGGRLGAAPLLERGPGQQLPQLSELLRQVPDLRGVLEEDLDLGDGDRLDGAGGALGAGVLVGAVAAEDVAAAGEEEAPRGGPGPGGRFNSIKKGTEKRPEKGTESPYDKNI